jgi:hypothetical protein
MEGNSPYTLQHHVNSDGPSPIPFPCRRPVIPSSVNVPVSGLQAIPAPFPASVPGPLPVSITVSVSVTTMSVPIMIPVTVSVASPVSVPVTVSLMPVCSIITPPVTSVLVFTTHNMMPLLSLKGDADTVR